MNKLFQEKSAVMLEHFSNGYTTKAACEKAGIGEETFYGWMRRNSEYAEMVRNARKEGEQRSIADVEASLLDLAKGYDYEEVRTEYESKLNPTTGKYEPTIKKQVRTKRHVMPSTEAIKFYLTNKAPELWKNRVEQTNNGKVATDLTVRYINQSPGDEIFPSSENEVDAER